MKRDNRAASRNQEARHLSDRRYSGRVKESEIDNSARQG